MTSPEARAREIIDAKLAAPGWTVQHMERINLSASRGIAEREFLLKSGFGFTDCLLYVDGQVVGMAESKAVGHSARGVESQLTRYSGSLPETSPVHHRLLPFACKSIDCPHLVEGYGD